MIWGLLTSKLLSVVSANAIDMYDLRLIVLSAIYLISLDLTVF